MTDHPIDKRQTCQVSKHIHHLLLIIGGRQYSLMPKKRDEELPPELVTLPGRLRIESSARPNPSAEILVKIAGKMGCNLHFLLTGQGEMWIHPPSEARKVSRR